MGTQFGNSQGGSQHHGGGVMGGRNEQVSFHGRNCFRRIRNVVTKRNVNSTIMKVPEPSPNTYGMNEVDTNADTCCLGTNFIPLYYTNRSADVYPYHDAYEPLENVPIVSGATAVDHEDGSTYIIVINEALYYGKKMQHSLINPNQIRHYGLDFLDYQLIKITLVLPKKAL